MTGLQLGELPWHYKQLLNAFNILILISLEHFIRINLSIKRMSFPHSLRREHILKYRCVCCGPRPPTKFTVINQSHALILWSF
jgi:hypothetical protein